MYAEQTGGDGLQTGSTGSDGGGDGMLVELLETEVRFGEGGVEGGGVISDL